MQGNWDSQLFSGWVAGQKKKLKKEKREEKKQNYLSQLKWKQTSVWTAKENHVSKMRKYSSIRLLVS